MIDSFEHCGGSVGLSSHIDRDHKTLRKPQNLLLLLLDSIQCVTSERRSFGERGKGSSLQRGDSHFEIVLLAYCLPQ